ncbi:MAG: hypothetical protein ABIZ80_01995, partial [Bryobacteraceae bacterium]
ALEELTRKLKLARQESDRYPVLVQQEAEWSRTVAALGDTGKTLRHTLARLDLLIELWPLWAGREAARIEMESFSPIDEFPVDPELRLATLAEQIHAAQTAVDRFDADLAGKRQLQAQLTEGLDPALAARREAVEEHHSLLALHRDRLHQVPPARIKRDQVEMELWKKLRQLGPDWDEARLEELSLSIPRSEEVRHWQRRLDAAERSLAEARHNWELAADELQKLKTSSPTPVAPDVETPSLELREQALRRMPLRVGDLRVQEGRTEALERLLDERKAAITGSQPQVSTNTLVVLAIYSGIAACAGWLYAQGEVILASILTAVDVAIATVLLFARRKASASYLQAHSEYLRAQTELADSFAQAAGLAEEIRKNAALLQISPNASVEQLETVGQELAAEQRELSRREDSRARLHEGMEHEGHRKTSLETADEVSAALNREWAEWKKAGSMPEALSPQTLLEFLAEAQQARSLVVARDEARANLSQVSGEVAMWEQPVRFWLRTGTEGEALIADFLELHRRCREDNARRTRIAALDDSLSELSAELEAARRELARSQEGFRTLLSEARARDEADFQFRLHCYKRRQELLRLIAERDAHIRVRIGKGEPAESFERDIATGRIEEWKAQAEKMQRDLILLQARRDEAVGRLRLAGAARSALEESSDVAALEVEEHSLRAELARAADEWRVAALARGLVERTLGEFSRTRQPAVLEHASAAFGRVTAGAYQKVVQDDGGWNLTVLDRNQQRKRPEELSRGTAEQLYLCLRMALAAEFERRSTPLPLVMDDVLVNFDPERAAAVAQEIAAFAQGRQVLLFTCHPQTANLLLGSASGARLIRMGRHGDSLPQE